MRDLMTPAERFDVPKMLDSWRWLVPARDTPLFVSGMGDWAFGAPDGSLWCLDLLEGTYSRIAADAAEYNRLNKSHAWLEKEFSIDWFDVALQKGLVPGEQECVGWRLHPLLGGKFEVANLKIFDMLVYQSLMGQLHRQLQKRAAPTAPKKPWYRF
jgi:hypothetical protein